MLVHIPHVLNADELAAMRARLAKAVWMDGRVTAGQQSARVKENVQLAAPNATPDALAALFDTAGRLFGVSFVPRTDCPVYHPDVRTYEVRDPAGKAMRV